MVANVFKILLQCVGNYDKEQSIEDRSQEAESTHRESRATVEGSWIIDIVRSNVLST